MEEEKKEEPRRKEDEHGDDDDEEEDDSWKKQFPASVATVALSPPNNNNDKPKDGGEQEDGEDTDATSSTTLCSASVPDSTPMSSWSSSASSSPLTLSSTSVYSQPQRPQLKRRPVASISKSSSSSSSSALSKPSKINNTVSQQQQQQQRQDVRQQLTLVVVLMASSTALVIWTLLPVASIVAILIWMASLTATLHVAYRALLIEYQYMLQHDGLRPYLPASIVQQLTQTTLHEYMTDPSFGLEYQHMLLYFLPLSRDQLEFYLQRLAPRHQYRLRRPGLGFLLGDDWMRHVVGEPAFQQLLQQQQNQQQQQQQQQQAVAVPPIMTPSQQQQSTHHPRQLLLQEGIVGDGSGTSVSSNHSMDIHRVMDGHDDDDDDDDASDLGMEITESDLPGGTMNEQQATGMARWLGLLSPEPQQRPVPVEASVAATTATTSTATTSTTTRAPATSNPPTLLDSQLQTPQPPPPPLPLQQDPEIQQEGQVIYDAFYSLFTDYSNIAYQSVGQVVVDMVDASTPSVIQSSLGLSLVSASVVLLGWWQGVYQFQRLSSAAPNSSSIQGPSMMTRSNTTSTTWWFPSPWFVTSTGLLGGALAGTIALFRFSVRRAFLPPAPSKPTDDSSTPPSSNKDTKTASP